MSERHDLRAEDRRDGHYRCVAAAFEFQGDGDEWIDVAEGPDVRENNAHVVDSLSSTMLSQHTHGLSRLPLCFKQSEAPLLLPLRRGFFAAVQERLAAAGRFVCAQHLASACGVGSGEFVLLCPKAPARQEVMFHAGAGHLLQLGVAQVEFFCGAHIFMGQIDPRDAFVIG